MDTTGKPDMMSKQIDKANKLYSIGIKNLRIQLELIGTNFVVLRPKNNSKWKNVFGGSYSSDSTLENDYEQFTAKLIINQNDFTDVWNRNRDMIEAYTDVKDLEVGDELQYTRDNRTFRFKITLKQGFSEASGIFYIYTLSSIIETLDM